MININVSDSYLSFTRHLALKLSALLALAITVPVQAQNVTWTGNGTDANWTTAANWGGAAPVANGNLTFSGNNLTANVNNFPAGTQFGKIDFSNNNNTGRTGVFSLSGSSITLGGAITASATRSAGGTIQDTIANDLIVNAAGPSVNASGNHTVRLTGNLTLAGSSSYAFAVADATTFSGAGGTIIFQSSGNNTTPTLSYSGSVPGTISRAITISATGNGLGNVRATQANSQFIYNGVFTGRATQFSMDGSNTNVTSDWQSDFGNGDNTATNVQKSGTGNWLISGAIKTGAGNLTVAGTGSLTLTNATNDFTGAVSVNNGQLNFTSIGNQTQASALGAGGLITLGSNATTATLNYIGSTNMTSNRTVRLGGDAGAAGNVYTGVISNNGTGTLVWTSTVFMPIQTSYNGTRSLVLSGTNAGDNEIQGTILDQTDVTAITNLTKNGAGKWILSGNNTYTGNTTVTAGTLGLTGNSTSPVSLAAGTVLQLALASPVTSTSTLSFAGNATVSIIGTPAPATTYNLFTGSAITGTPALSAPISGFALSNNGTVLQLVPSGGGGDTTKPIITLNGNATVTVVAGATYTDAGATATDETAPANPTVTTTGTVNAAVPGVYTLSYDAVDTAGNAALTVTRTVTVVDTTNPVITLSGNATVTLVAGTSYTDAGATATDETAPANPTVTTTGTVNAAIPGVYSLSYNAVDAAGNAALTVTRTVTVVDTTKPVITLSGNATVSIAWGAAYTDAGATATDETAPANPTIITSGTVNTAKPGTYLLSYNAVDAAGNAAITVTRTVTVAIANSTTVGADGYTPLMRYALGANGPGDTVAAPVTSATASALSLTAVVRTDDPKLSVVGTTRTDLTTGTWATTGVSGSPAGSGTVGDQTGVTTGQRRVYTVTTAAKTFLRLEATLAP